LAETVTIRDVAKYAGVGVGTVSRVLNDSQAVRDSTRRKVLEAIEDLKFSPSPAARRLSSGKTMVLGVIVPFFTNASVVKRLQGVASVVASSAYDLILFDVEKEKNREGFITKIIRRQLVDGLIIVSLRPSNEDFDLLFESKIPVVIVDVAAPRLNSIIVDNVRGGAIAAQHLVDLGHKKIGYISDYPNNPFNSSPVFDRFEGFRQVLAQAGIPFRKEYYREGNIDRSSARHLAHELLTLPDPPTAIFAYCDAQAFGVIEAARDLQLRIPEDLSLVGFDDIEAAEFAQLTTVRQSLFESGVIGAELMLEAIANPYAKTKEILLLTELVVRHTTASPMV